MKSRKPVTIFCRILLIAVIIIFSALEVSAKNIAGVDVPQSLMVGNEALVLNGAGIRKKLFIKVYVGSLYLPTKLSTVKGIMDEPGAKSIVMNFLYKEVSAKKIVDGWNRGFKDNNSTKEIASLQKRIDQFNSLFTTVFRGDEIRLDYMPGKGTQVIVNGEVKGVIKGEDFYQALLKIWLGFKPADVNLKDAMLGN